MKYILSIVFTLIVFASTAQQIRNFSLEDLQNNTQKLENLKGKKLTLIDFWASWCKPCLKGIPSIEAIYKNNKAKGVEVIGINCDGPRSIAKVQPLVNALGITYPVLTDISNGIMQDLEVRALPTLILIDSNNKIVYRHEGFTKGDKEEIQKKIDELLQ